MIPTLKMFENGGNYLILGYRDVASEKTKLGLSFLKMLDPEYKNSQVVNLMSENYDIPDNVPLLFDNYSSKHNRNSTINNIINDKTRSVIIISPYPLALAETQRMYMDYIFVPYFEDVKLVYAIYLKEFMKIEQYKKLNNELSKNEFLFFNKNTKSFGKYSQPFNNSFYNLWNKFILKISYGNFLRKFKYQLNF